MRILLAFGMIALALAAAMGALALRRVGAHERWLADLDVRLATLEHDLVLLQNDVEARRIDVEDVPVLRARLQWLEQALERSGALPSGASLQASTVAKATRTVLDEASSVDVRLEALRQLQGERLADGTDARIPLVPALIELAQTSKDPRVRADVWRSLSGCPTPALQQPLLHALASDEAPRVREEAAEALTAFMPEPEVHSALRNAAEVDTDERVRRQARKAMHDWVR